jgi:hypothetical protein
MEMFPAPQERKGAVTVSAATDPDFNHKSSKMNLTPISDAAQASPEAIAEADEFILDQVYRDLCLIGSYTTSAIEASRRGDRDELRLHLRVQLRDCFRHAVQLHNLLSTPEQAVQVRQ